MAIYGQMTSRPAADEEREEEEGEEVKDKLKQVTAEATKDLEEVLSHLSESIDDLTSGKSPSLSATPTQTEQPHPPTEPPHFTLANSPTNRRGPEISPPRDPTIV